MLDSTRTGLAQTLARRVDDERSGYLLVYTARGVKTGDGWHRIDVRLRNRSSRVQARSGYFAWEVAHARSTRLVPPRSATRVARNSTVDASG